MGMLATARRFNYDSLDRVITAKCDDLQGWVYPASMDTSWYSYDDLSNRISHSYRDDTAFAYEHDKANRMTLIDSLSQDYDLAGNVTLSYSADRGTSFKYEYHHLNQLTAVYDDTGTDRSATLGPRSQRVRWRDTAWSSASVAVRSWSASN